MKKPQLEYVASGTAHLGLSLRRNYAIPGMRDEILKLFGYLNGLHNHKFSLLFNAFIERKFGEAFQHYRESIYNIHADSGGLQIVTRGMEITPELKDKIYKNQAQYSDIAMSFDEIPVKTIGVSVIGNTSNRIFDKEKVDYYATLTGQNLQRQIEVFIEENSKARPLLVAQGNCYDTYMQWVDTVYKQVPQELHGYIGGVAIAGAALGNGPLEDIQRAAFVSQFENPNKHIHILGVGSVYRLLPYLIFAQNGFYKDNFHISYDSTSHTAGASQGYYFTNGKLIRLSRNMNSRYHGTFRDLEKMFRLSDYEIDEQYFFDVISKREYSVYHEEDKTFNEKELIKFSMCVLGLVAGSISNFTKMVDLAVTDKNYLLELAKQKKNDRDMASLYSITNIDDFQKWYNQVGHHIKSQKIASHESATLEEFF